MPPTRRRPPAVRQAAEQLIDALAADPVLVAYISEAAIAAKVASGELVPAQRLMIGELMLQPVTRVAELEATIRTLNDAIDDALDALDAGDPGQAASVLAATIPPDEADEEVPVDEPEFDDDGDEPEVGPEPEPDAEPERDVDPDPEPEPDRGDTMPDITHVHPCVECAAEVPGAEAQITWVRFKDPETGRGVVLCKACAANK